MKLYRSICLLSLTCVFLFACKTESHKSESDVSRSINIYSHQLDSDQEKTEILKKYLKKESGLIDAEYHITYMDNSTGRIPGPSDYDIKLALKVEPDSLDSWITNLELSSKRISAEYWDDLKLDKEEWNLESEPELYLAHIPTEVKLLYREENIVLAVYATIPVNLKFIE